MLVWGHKSQSLPSEPGEHASKALGTGRLGRGLHVQQGLLDVPGSLSLGPWSPYPTGNSRTEPEKLLC